jgi:hypothetical protein
MRREPQNDRDRSVLVTGIARSHRRLAVGLPLFRSDGGADHVNEVDADRKPR